jgi:hypothetical protein
MNKIVKQHVGQSTHLYFVNKPDKSALPVHFEHIIFEEKRNTYMKSIKKTPK